VYRVSDYIQKPSMPDLRHYEYVKPSGLIQKVCTRNEIGPGGNYVYIRGISLGPGQKSRSTDVTEYDLPAFVAPIVPQRPPRNGRAVPLLMPSPNGSSADYEDIDNLPAIGLRVRPPAPTPRGNLPPTRKFLVRPHTRNCAKLRRIRLLVSHICTSQL